MKKIILLIISFLCLACTNTNFYKISPETKSDLVKFTLEIKQKISENDIEFLEKNMKDSVRNRYIVNHIKKIDFSQMNIFISEPEFKENEISSKFAINAYDKTLYYQIYFIYDGGWKISNIEKRG